MTKLLLCLLLLTQATFAAEPGLRLTIPRTGQPPKLDGVLAPGEWDDAAATTGLISQFGQVVHPRQAVFWLKYDATNIYLACRSTCFPEERDGATPQLWQDRDSSLVVGLDPQRPGRGSQPSHFLLRANINKQLLGQEIFWELEGVKVSFPHPAWTSGATVGQKIENGVWVSELSIPLKNLKVADLKEGEEWGLLLGRDYSAADQSALTLSSDWHFGDGLRHYGRAFYNNYRLEKEYGRMTLGGQSPVVQLLDLGDVVGGRPTPTVTVKNTTAAPLRVVVREEWRSGSGPQEATLELKSGEQQSHTFKAVRLPADKTQVCRIVVTGPGGVLLAQEIPMMPGWGADRSRSIPEPYFSGNHFGHLSGRDPYAVPLMPTGYDPITNEFYGRFRLGNLPEIHLATRGEITIRRQGANRPVAAIPLKWSQPNVMLMFQDLSFNYRPATVLEWVAPRDGDLDINLEGTHDTYGATTPTDGEALQVLHVSAADKKTAVLIPRQVFIKVKQWTPLVVNDLPVRAGDKIQFYYDKNGQEGCDDFRLRGTMTFTTPAGKTVYNPAGDMSSQQGGRTGVWFYRYDTDATPNPDGVYPELAWMTQTNWFNWVGWMKLWPADPTRHMALMQRIVEGADMTVTGKLPALTPGVYEANAEILTKDGRVLGRARQTFIRYDHRKDLSWLFEKVGVSTKVLPPWTPIRATRVAGGLALDCWGRSYRFGADGLINGILNQGTAQLSAPVSMQVLKDKQPVALATGPALSHLKTADHEADYTGQQSGGGLRITTAGHMEYDGYVQHTVTIAPVHGAARVDAVRLIIALKPEEATYLHAAAGDNMRAQVVSIKLRNTDGQLWHSGQRYAYSGEEPDKEPFGKIMTAGNFRPYVWIGNEDRGLAFMADNDAGWVPDDTVATPAIEVVRRNGVVELVLNLVARPFTFAKARTITFSLQATPIRSVPDDVRARSSRLHMATAFPGHKDAQSGWVWTGQMYQIKDDAGTPYWLFGNPGSAPYPLSWDISTWYREACEAGAFHGMKVISTPYQSQLNVMTFPEVADPRMPPGKQVSDVCGYIYPHISHGYLEDGNPNMTEPDRDYRLWCYRNWIKHVGLKGMYFDQTQPVLAANPKAGMGYVMDLPDRPALHGRIQPGYGLTGMRDFYKRLRTLFVEHGEAAPYIWLHTTDANMVSAFAFSEFLLEGENGPSVNRQTPVCEKIPPHRQQAMRNSAGGLGYTQLEMIDIPANPDQIVWRDIGGWFMLHDICQIGTYNWAGLDLNRHADFLPYWSPRIATTLTTTNPEVYASAWRQDNKLRVLVFNRNPKPVSAATVQLDLTALGLTATAGKSFVATELESDAKPEIRGAGELKAEGQGGRLTVTVPVMERNFRLFKIEQR